MRHKGHSLIQEYAEHRPDAGGMTWPKRLGQTMDSVALSLPALRCRHQEGGRQREPGINESRDIRLSVCGTRSKVTEQS